MKKFTNQFNGSHADRINNGGGRFRRIALFPLMLLMLLLGPTSMVAQTDYDNTVTFTALEGNPLGISDAESYHKLFDGQKKEGNSTKWCCNFYGSAYVIFEASKAGIPVGYTITTGNDNSNWKGRNPKSWKLYGNNEGQNGNWTLIQEVNNDTKLQDVNCTSYDFTCEKGKTSYQYFKWEISAIHSGDVLQVGEFELKLQTCTHTNADGTSALGDPIENVETTCTEHGYTTYNCSICHSIVKKYKTDELKKHTLTHHEAKDGVKEHWQCDVCHKYFSDADATQEVSYASLLYPAYAVFEGSTGTLTFKCSPSKPEGAYDLNEGEGQPAWINQSDNIKKVVFDTSFAMARPTSCYWWFAGCKNLTEIEGVENLNTRNVTSMRNMFDACSNLESLDLSNFDTQNVIYMNYMFYGCSKLTSLDLSKFNNQKVTGMISMFEGCSGLKSLNLSKFNTQSVTDMSNMFYGCSGLTSLDLSNFNTQNVEYMGSMFKGCTGLTSLNLSMFNTQNVTNMGWMFMGCSSLESLNLSNFDTQNVKHMSDMFSGCSALTSLDLSMFNTQNVEYMSCMFMGCSGLTSLDLSKFDTQKLQGMSGMFSGCSGLTSLDLSKFDTQNVFDMMSVFENCSGLTSLDLSNFNTQNVEFMLSMFKGCSGLTSLDLSNFDTKKVERMSDMFSGCSSLTTIYASDKFVITEHSYGIAMFSGCTLLKGVIAYGEDKTDHTYANYKTGYFTKLVGKNGNEKIGASGETLTAASLALDDEKDFVAYESFSAKAASYNREMKEGTIWATLCLPFEVSLADKNFRAFKLLSANESTSTIQLEEITTSITAGTPVIIKMNNGETTLSFSEANKEIAQKVVSAADGSYQLQGLYTKKVFDKSADDNCYIVKGNKLMNPTKLLENTSTTQVGSKPFRAYMVDNTSSSAGAKMFSIAIGDNTTAIDSLNTIADGNAIYYDLQGNRLSAPQKGINIVKRGNKTMKVIIK